ncbi:MAG: hypothetical protein K9N51_09640 [Candidatus Pacebacteria bacterium]|nr:hypothetical protein [Candidatus Paceibacterota bacterium]
MSKLKEFFHINAATPGSSIDDDRLDDNITQDEHKEQLELDKSILTDDGTREKRVQKDAEKRVVSAAEISLKRLHMIRMGRCPDCGEHLRRHLFASICEACGWHTYDVPRQGGVRVHVTDRNEAISGDRCYRVKGGSLLVVKNELVIARISRESIKWIEYQWPEQEVDQRHREVAALLEVQCGWCGNLANPEEDGFHLVHVAFGATQERYCFCSDDCYEAFRRMYPARVDRNCYERNCADCNLCIKRYDDEAEGFRVLAKDFVKMKRLAEGNPAAATKPSATS